MKEMKEKLIDKYEESINDDSNLMVQPPELFIDAKTEKKKEKKNQHQYVN